MPFLLTPLVKDSQVLHLILLCIVLLPNFVLLAIFINIPTPFLPRSLMKIFNECSTEIDLAGTPY